MLSFSQKLEWPAKLIFTQEINMASHADFFTKNKLLVMLIFYQKINMAMHADFF